jgi:hypothetical protein
MTSEKTAPWRHVVKFIRTSTGVSDCGEGTVETDVILHDALITLAFEEDQLDLKFREFFEMSKRGSTPE